MTFFIVDWVKKVFVKLKNKCWKKKTETIQQNSMSLY